MSDILAAKIPRGQDSVVIVEFKLECDVDDDDDDDCGTVSLVSCVVEDDASDSGVIASLLLNSI